MVMIPATMVMVMTIALFLAAMRKYASHSPHGSRALKGKQLSYYRHQRWVKNLDCGMDAGRVRKYFSSISHWTRLRVVIPKGTHGRDEMLCVAQPATDIADIISAINKLINLRFDSVGQPA